MIQHSTYWNQGYGYQQGYGQGYGVSDDSPHGYYSYGTSYYYRLKESICLSSAALILPSSPSPLFPAELL
ncbi:Kininogen-1 [Manis pentadactyla]|nr:Kininogen-1 [Manis pentadactyla]